MKISIVQKVQIWLLQQFINVLWTLDVVTGYPLNQSARFVSRPYVFVSVLLIGVLTYFIYIPFLFNVLPHKNKTAPLPVYMENPVVLGISEKKETLPKLSQELPFPLTSAKAVLVVDANTDKILFERNVDSKYASASTTKLMTALVALNVYSLDDVITVSTDCASVESTRAGLLPGEKFSVRELINVMLVASAGDAACLLGTDKIDSNEFLYLMNESAYKYGMQNTFFTNTIGLDGINSSQFSSARDLYLLAKATTTQPFLKEIVAQKQVSVASESGQNVLNLDNTNVLLSEIPNSVGIKTGTTTEAGEVLIYEYAKDNTDIIIIIMGSVDRFGETKAILDWTLKSYSWEETL